MKPLLISGGRVIDPECQFDDQADILIESGVIKAVEKNIEPPEGGEIIAAGGLVIMPGLIDMHVHLRDPGQEYKEDIFSGARAAAAGGFTAVAAMANTEPVCDNPALISHILNRSREAVVRVYPVGALTRAMKGEELAEMGLMRLSGAVAFSDDGLAVVNGTIMRNALHYARAIDALIIVHEEDRFLSAGGMMHEGTVSSMLGLPGIPAAAEEAMLARDLILLKMTGGRLHVAHVSTAGSVELIRKAKAEGLAVTAEVTPHHLFLSDRAVKNSGYHTSTKVNPPLRPEHDRSALWAGLLDGTIDVIASDHAPHHPDDKDVEFDFAPFGIAGLETSLPLMLDELFSGRNSKLSYTLLAEKMSRNPALILGVEGGNLRPGRPADLTIIDPERSVTVKPEAWYCKSRNTPFEGRRLMGTPVYTLVRGKMVMKEGVITE